MIRISNTISGKKEALTLRSGKEIALFVCGPTVYDASHIGHARTYIAFDIIVKYLRARGYSVFYLQNITDVDDKIIQRAKEKRESPRTIARLYEKMYLQDIKTLKVTSVTKYARATAHIKEIVNQVERLLKKGYAYETEDGIYFDIAKFKRYGKLSKRTAEQAEDATSRIDESVQKRNKGDFALWKFVSNAQAKSGMPSWKTTLGQGRPGWHIEDTAITETYFGSQYDIHGGARDLIFPHHEAEIAQMEAVSGKQPLVHYWMHTGFLTVRGEKMSKSLGNFITIQDFLETHEPRLLRFLVGKLHYRSPIDYSEDALVQAERELERIDEFISKIAVVSKGNSKGSTGAKLLQQAQKSFEVAMEDDFNTPGAIAALFELIKEGNKVIDGGRLTKKEAKAIRDWLKQIDRFFGFLFPARSVVVPVEVRKLVDKREQYRSQKQWDKADNVRQQLETLGWNVEDAPSDTRIRRIKTKK